MTVASLVGTPLRLDASTRTLKRPSIARVQIEIDLLQPHLEEIWIGVEGDNGFWKRLEYDDVPDYCRHCWHVGHSEQQCTVHQPELKAPAVPKKPAAPCRKAKLAYAPKPPPDSSQLAPLLAVPVPSKPPMDPGTSTNGPSPPVIAQEPGFPPQLVQDTEDALLQDKVHCSPTRQSAPNPILDKIGTVRMEPLPLIGDQFVEIPDDAVDEEFDAEPPHTPRSLALILDSPRRQKFGTKGAHTIHQEAGLLISRKARSAPLRPAVETEGPTRAEQMASFRDFSQRMGHLQLGVEDKSQSLAASAHDLDTQQDVAPRRGGKRAKPFIHQKQPSHYYYNI